MQPSELFNIAQAASSYAEISGILAGFSFAVLFWILEKLEKSEDSETSVTALVFLVAIFLGNIITSVLWALVAGTVKESTALILMIFATLNFTLMIPLTIQTVILVIATSNNTSFVNKALPLSNLIYATTIFLMTIYVYLTGKDFLALQSQGFIITNVPTTPSLNFWLLATFLPLFAIVPKVQRFLKSSFSVLSSNKRFPKQMATISKFKGKISNKASFIWAYMGFLSTSAVFFGFYHGELDTSPSYLHPIGIAIMFLFWTIIIVWSANFLTNLNKSKDNKAVIENLQIYTDSA